MTLKVGTKVTVTTTLLGSSWTASCGGRRMSSIRWYRISAINGRSVRSLYGVAYLYAATGMFRTLPKPVVVPPANGLTEGIDISHWQGTIDWIQVAAAGKRFAFMKASEDIDYVDPTYPANRAAANANGMSSAPTTSRSPILRRATPWPRRTTSSTPRRSRRATCCRSSTSRAARPGP